MTRPEAIEYLKWLRGQTDICYACHDCITTDKCELQAVIDLLEREQEDDDRLDALRFASMELVAHYDTKGIWHDQVQQQEDND